MFLHCGHCIIGDVDFQGGFDMHEVYESTRNRDRKITSKQAIFEGISPDGGLYVWPELA